MLDGSDDEEDETKHPDPGGRGSKPTSTEEFLVPRDLGNRLLENLYE